MRARYYLIILIAGLAFIAILSLSGAFRHQPLRYGYSLTLELEADGKSYSARSTYACEFAGAVEQEGIVFGPDLLIYEGKGEPLALSLDDGRVIVIQFKPHRSFCQLNDQGRFWRWRGVPELETSGDHRRGFELINRGFVERRHMREAKAVVDAAFEEKRSVDVLATRKMLFTLWIFDSADDPSLLRHLDWRVPERALGDSVRLKRIVIEPTREAPKSTLRSALPWATSHSPAAFLRSNRWVRWSVVAEAAPAVSGAMEPLQGAQFDGGPRFYAISRSNELNSSCKNNFYHRANISNVPGHAAQFIVPQIDVPNNRVSFSWSNPPFGHGDFARLDKLALGSGESNGVRWLLWDPQFCVDDGGCFKLGKGPRGEGYPFSWQYPASSSFVDIGGTYCVYDKKAKAIYRLQLSAKIW